MLFAKILHVLGIILWLGGGASAAFTMVLLASESKDVRVAAARAVRKLVLYVVTPGMLLAWAGGLINLLTYWSTLYAKAPWMHTKLTVGLIATAFSGVLSGRLRRASASGDDVSVGAMKLAGGVLLISALLGVLAVFMRFGSAG
jgi:uncharacterized membrane protein